MRGGTAIAVLLASVTLLGAALAAPPPCAGSASSSGCEPTCDEGMVYNDQSGECVSMSCPAGELFAMATFQCVPYSGAECRPGTAWDPEAQLCRELVGVACIDGHEWDADMVACREDCSMGGNILAAWDPVRQGCVALRATRCAPGFAFDSMRKTCTQVVDTQCPAGFVFEELSMTCIPDIVAVRCADGYSYDAVTEDCFRVATMSCTMGRLYDKQTGRCVVVDETRCPEGTFFDSVTKQCIVVSELLCPPGFVLNPATMSCVQITVARCPIGTVWDAIGGTCVIVDDVACLPGWRFDLATLQCVCAEGYTSLHVPSTGRDICVVTPEPTVCAEGSVWDALSSSCIELWHLTCPQGAQYDAIEQRCIDVRPLLCGRGLTLDLGSATCKTLVEVTCAAGTEFDWVRHRCVCSDGFMLTREGECIPAVPLTCPPGHMYHRGGHSCIEVASVQCPHMWEFNPTFLECQPLVQTVSCRLGSVWDGYRKRCVVLQPTQCAAGLSYDLLRRHCFDVSTTLCQPGTVYDPASLRCVHMIETRCPATHVFDTLSHTCMQQLDTACPPGFILTSEFECICPPGFRHWNEERKCVPFAEISCAADTLWSATAQSCVRLLPTECPLGSSYDQGSGTCVTLHQVTCPPGSVFEASLLRCLQLELVVCKNNMLPTDDFTCACPLGKFLEPNQQRCLTMLPADCRPGWSYDAISKSCMLQADAYCPRGSLWDTVTFTCYDALPAGCADGATFDLMSRSCLTTIPGGCPPGFIFDSHNAECITVEVASCPTGLLWDGVRNDCVDVVCGVGTLFDEATQTCRGVQDIICRQNNVWDYHNMRCIRKVAARCPDGVPFDAMSKQCMPMLNTQCSPGHLYDSVRQTCYAVLSVQCPDGWAFDHREKECSPVLQHVLCSDGRFFEPSVGRCLVPPVPLHCAEGYFYEHNVLEKCISLEPARCAPGYIRDGGSLRCVAPLVPVRCAPGKAWFHAAGICVDLPRSVRCADPTHVWVDEVNGCGEVFVPPIPAFCANPTHVYNPDMGTCHTPPQAVSCPGDMVYEWMSHRCVELVPAVCRYPQVFDEATLECVPDCHATRYWNADPSVWWCEDLDAPSVVSANIYSRGPVSDQVARDGDDVVVRVVFDEPVHITSMSIAGSTVAPRGQSDEVYCSDPLDIHAVLEAQSSGICGVGSSTLHRVWYADLALSAASHAGGVVSFSAAGTDPAGLSVAYSGESGTDGVSLTFDATPPSVTSVTWESDNLVTARAAGAAHNVEIVVEVSEPSFAPGETIAANRIFDREDWVMETAQTVTIPASRDVCGPSHQWSDMREECAMSGDNSDGEEGGRHFGEAEDHYDIDLGTRYSLTFDAARTDEGVIEVELRDILDASWNALSTDPTTSDGNGDSVTVDHSPPEVSSLTMRASDNDAVDVARAGNTLEVLFYFDEPVLVADAVATAGVFGSTDDVDVYANGGTTCSSCEAALDSDLGLEYVFALTDPDGLVSVSVVVTDWVGNSDVLEFTEGTDQSAVRLDNEPPEFVQITFESDNEHFSTWTKVGDTFTATVAMSEPTLSFDALVAGQQAVVTGEPLTESCLQPGEPPCAEGVTSLFSTFQVSYTLVDGDREGYIELVTVSPVDEAGNTGALYDGSAGTDDSVVEHRSSPPAIATLTWVSSNPLAGYAAIGDIITAEIALTRPIRSPSVTVMGQQATILYPDADVEGRGLDRQWELDCPFDMPPFPDGECDADLMSDLFYAEYILQEGDPEGTVAVIVNDIFDAPGNSGDSGDGDGTIQIQYDGTAPVIMTVTWESVGHPKGPRIARFQDSIRVVATFDERVSKPTVSVSGETAFVEGAAQRVFSRAAVLELIEAIDNVPDGWLQIEISIYADAIGNEGLPWVDLVGTNGLGTFLDGTPPSYSSVTWEGSNPENPLLLRPFEVLTIRIVGSEGVEAPTVTVSGITIDPADVVSLGPSACRALTECVVWEAWEATFTMSTDDPEGPMLIEVSAPIDEALNTGAAFAATVGTDGLSTVYRALALVNFGTFNAEIVQPCDVVRVSISYDLQIDSGTAVVGAAYDGTTFTGGHELTFGDLSGGEVPGLGFIDNLVQLEYVVASGDVPGPISIAVWATDTYGNVAYFENSEVISMTQATVVLPTPVLTNQVPTAYKFLNADREILEVYTRLITVRATFDQPTSALSAASFVIGGDSLNWESVEITCIDSVSSRAQRRALTDTTENARDQTANKLPRALQASNTNDAGSSAQQWSGEQPAAGTCQTKVCYAWRVDAVIGSPLVGRNVSIHLPNGAVDLFPVSHSSNTLSFEYIPPTCSISTSAIDDGIVYTIRFSRSVTGFSTASYEVLDGGLGLESTLSGSGSEYEVAVDMSGIDHAIISLNVPEGAPGVRPEPMGPTLNTIEYACGEETNDACVNGEFFYSAPTVAGITIPWEEVHHSSEVDVDPESVVWSWVGGSVDEPNWIQTEEGNLQFVDVLLGGRLTFSLAVVDIDGYAHSVRARIEILQLSITKPIQNEVLYTDRVQSFRWQAFRVPPERFVRIAVLKQAASTSQPNTNPLVQVPGIFEIIRVTETPWTWRVPARQDTTGQYWVRLSAVESRARIPPKHLLGPFFIDFPVSMTVSEWSACSASCGPGKQSRSVTCRDKETGDLTPIDICSRYYDIPALERDCDAGECQAPTWSMTPYGPCSVPCGGGKKERVVSCLLGSSTVADSECLAQPESNGGGKKPPSSVNCNQFACDKYEWFFGEWGTCSEPCGEGEQERDVFCRTTTSQSWVPDSFCENQVDPVLATPEVVRACDLGSCDVPFFLVGTWSACNIQCGGGTSFRSVRCFFNAETEALTNQEFEECVIATEEIGLEYPAAFKSCNTAPCFSYGYLSGPWTECTQTCGGGWRDRTLECARTGSGSRVIVDVSECNAQLGEHLRVPKVREPCNTEQCDAGFCTVTDPCTQRGECVDTGDGGGYCECDEGYSGLRCQTTEGCPEGSVPDVDGECCLSGLLDLAHQLCCMPEGDAPAVLDSRGECCPSGHIDACGECDGSSITTDALGNCCPGPLDAGGLCCHSGNVDICGVCDGTNSCPTVARLGSQLTGMTIDEAYDLGVVDEFMEAVRAALGLDSTFSVHVRLDDAEGEGSGDGEGTVRRLEDAVYSILRVAPTDVAERDRRLQAVLGASLQVTVQPVAGATSAKPGLERRMMGLTAVTTEALEPTGLESVGREPVCGNGVCERGERCTTLDDPDCCSKDCAYQLLPCPTAEGMSESCSGRGVCVSATGECDCFEGKGYGGIDCNSCMVGFTDFGDGDCRILIVPEPIERNETTNVAGQTITNIFGDDPAKANTLLGGLIAALVVLCCMCFLCWFCKRRNKGVEVPQFVRVLNEDGDKAIEEVKAWDEDDKMLAGDATGGGAAAAAAGSSSDKDDFVVVEGGEDAPKLKTVFKSMYGKNPTASFYAANGLGPDGQPVHRKVSKLDKIRSLGPDMWDKALEGGKKGNKVAPSSHYSVYDGPERKPGELPHLVIGAVTPATVPLTWTFPEWDGGTPITKYKVSFEYDGREFDHYTIDDTPAFTIGGGGGNPASQPLEPGETITNVRVVACNRIGESLDALTVESVRTIAPPGRCGMLKVAGMSASSFTVHWAHPEDDGGSPLTTYEVAFTGPDGMRHVVSTGGFTDRFTLGDGTGDPRVNPMMAGTAVRRINVRAVNKAGEGPWLDAGDQEAQNVEIDEVILEDVPPSAPLELTAGGPTLHTIPISWLTPVGPAVLSHRVTYMVGGELVNVNTKSAETEFVIGGGGGSPESEPLPPGSLVSNIFVVAVSNSGRSGRSNTIQTVTTLRRAGAPVNAHVACTTATTARIEWLQPRDLGGAVLRSYQMRYTVEQPDGSEQTFIIDTEDTTPTFNIGSEHGTPASPPLRKGAQVRDISVAAVTRVGAGARSEPTLSCTTLAPPGPPMGVSVLTARKVGSGTGDDFMAVLPVTWIPATEFTGEDSERYAIKYTVGGETILCEAQAHAVVGDGDVPGTVEFDIGSGAGVPASTRLPRGAVVTDIQVASVNGTGRGAFSEPPQKGVLPDLPPPPRSLRVGGQSEAKVHLEWEEPALPEGQLQHFPAIVSYQVEYTKGGQTVICNTQSTTTGFTLGSGMGLPPCPGLQGGDLLKDVRVRAVNSVGDGEPSEALGSIVVTDIADQPELAIGDYTDSTVPVTWEPPGNMGGAEVERWVVRYTVRGKRYMIDTQSLDMSFVIGGGLGRPASTPLEPGVEVTDMTVQAVTVGVGPGMESEPLSVTPYVVAGDPTDLDVIRERITTSEIPIRWLAPTDGFEGDIIGYKVHYSVDGVVHVIETHSVEERFTIGGGDGEPASAPLTARTIVKQIKVCAVTTVGDSPYSVTLAPQRTLGLPVPSEVSFGKITATTAMLAWVPPTDDGGAPVETYIVKLKAGPAELRNGLDGGPERELTFDTRGPVNFINIGGGDVADNNGPLQRGTPLYDVEVRAVTRAGVGEPSAPVEGIRTHTVAVPPTDIFVEEDDDADAASGTILVSWMPPSDNGGAAVTAYAIKYRTNDTERSTMAACKPRRDGRCSFVIGGGSGMPASERMEPATILSDIRVSALNIAGESLPCSSGAEVQVAAPRPRRIDRPVTIRVVSSTASISVVWENPLAKLEAEGALGTSRILDADRIVEYEVQWKGAGGFAKAVNAAALERDMDGILFDEAVGHRFVPDELDDLFERRVATANAWPTWFDEVFEEPESSWLVSDKKIVKDVGGIVQHTTVVTTPKFSYEFRVRCKNQYGEWGKWSLPSRPVHLPAPPGERPVRPAVGGMRVYGTGGGYQASTEEIRRFIKENLEADAELGDMFGEWVRDYLWGLMRTFWRNQMLSLKKGRRAIAAERAPQQTKQRAMKWARNVETDDLEKISPKLDEAQVRDFSMKRKGIAGAAVRLSRSVWVPIAESAAAGRPSLLAMLPKKSSTMASSFHHDKKLNTVKRSTTTKKKKRVKEAVPTARGGAGGEDIDPGDLLMGLGAKKPGSKRKVKATSAEPASRAGSGLGSLRLPGGKKTPGLLPPAKASGSQRDELHGSNRSATASGSRRRV